MLTAEQNLRLLEEIDDNRCFLLQVLRENPALLQQAETRVKEWFAAVPPAPTFFEGESGLHSDV
jgi:hypothetical protein